MILPAEKMIEMYNPKTLEENKNVLREIVQSIILIGLSKSDFFSKASFYGGTALRILYDLNRYSEDLDVALDSNILGINLEEKIESLTSRNQKEKFVKKINSLAMDFI